MVWLMCSSTVPCSTYMVHPGWFDIFFPTDFDAMKGVYERLGGKGRTLTQRDFLKEYAGADLLKKTRTRMGENPMLGFYRNFRFLIGE
jgi:hypothetical protein